MSGRKNGFVKRFIFLLTLTFLVILSVAGISFSLWSDTLSVKPTINTGDLKAVVSIVSTVGSGTWNYDHTSRTISLNANNANPGETFSCTYRVDNRSASGAGTIPFKVRAVTDSDPDTLVTTSQPPDWELIDRGDFKDYVITVTMPNIPVFRYSSLYGFLHRIEIQQWINP